MGIFGPPNVEKLAAKGDVKGLISALRYKADGGDDRAKAVRCEAAKALGRAGDPVSVEPLVAALRGDRASSVRVSAAEALGQLGSSQAVESLVSVLEHDGEADVRLAVVGALDRIGDRRAAVPLAAALGDGDDTICWRAAEVLCRLGDERGVEFLIAALRFGTWGNRPVVTVTSLAHGADLAFARFSATVTAQQARVRCQAAEVLGRLGDQRARGPLTEALENPDARVRSAAAEALERLRDGQAQPGPASQ